MMIKINKLKYYFLDNLKIKLNSKINNIKQIKIKRKDSCEKI